MGTTPQHQQRDPEGVLQNTKMNYRVGDLVIKVIRFSHFQHFYNFYTFFNIILKTGLS